MSWLEYAFGNHAKESQSHQIWINMRKTEAEIMTTFNIKWKNENRIITKRPSKLPRDSKKLRNWQQQTDLIILNPSLIHLPEDSQILFLPSNHAIYEEYEYIGQHDMIEDYEEQRNDDAHKLADDPPTTDELVYSFWDVIEKLDDNIVADD
ncbi:8789_t:CDS:2, partial [Diversispora eburnea]